MFIIDLIIGLVLFIFVAGLSASIIEVIFEFLFKTKIGVILIVAVLLFILLGMLCELRIVGKKMRHDIVAKFKNKREKK